MGLSGHAYRLDAGDCSNKPALVSSDTQLGGSGGMSFPTPLQTIAINGRFVNLPTHRHLWPDVKALLLHRDATAG
jgi:hypothetical protein